MFDSELASLNAKVSALPHFDDKNGLAPIAKWLEKNAFPLSQKYEYELAVNVYKDLYKLRIGTIVTDKDISKINIQTLLSSRFGGLRYVAMSWHSHPVRGSLGRSSKDISARTLLKDRYEKFRSATFWVTYQDDIKGVISSEYKK